MCVGGRTGRQPHTETLKSHFTYCVSHLSLWDWPGVGCLEKVLVSTVGEKGALGEGPHFSKFLVVSEPQGPHLPKGSQSPLEIAQPGRWQAVGQGRPQVLPVPGSGSRVPPAHTTMAS